MVTYNYQDAPLMNTDYARINAERGWIPTVLVIEPI